MARYGVVTAGHYLSTAAGFHMLKNGGNAFDAAVAMGFACSVVEPQYYGLGGEVAILIYSVRDKKVRSISGQGPAPAAATIQWFKQHSVDPIPSVGFLPATVPASPAAWLTLLEKYGSMSVKDVLCPAIDLAENGYPAHSGVVGTICGALKNYPTTRNELEPGDRPPEIGEPIRTPNLARTFRRLVDAAERAPSREQGIRMAQDLFYRGAIAREIVNFANHTSVKDPTGKAHHALLAYEDLASYVTPIEEPVTVNYRGYDVYKCGPWTQGPVFLQQIELLRGFDLGNMGHNSADYIHTVVEAAKLAFADRDAYYGDPKFVNVPLDRLLSEAYADERRQMINPAHASMEIGCGGGAPSTFKSRRGLGPVPNDTTHLDAIDQQGNMVAATPSGGWIDMSPIIPGLGFALGVRGQMFWLDPARPNCLQPGKRPRTTITPTMVLKDEKALMSFGTLGGDFQDQWTLQFFLNYIDFGMNLQEAIDTPTFDVAHFFSSWSGHPVSRGIVNVEGRIDAKVVEELRRRGHMVNVQGEWVNGRVLAVAVDLEHGTLQAAASPRAETGYAIGW